MKVTIHKSEFMKVLTPAMGTVSNKNTITSIEGVLIETLDDGNVRLSTYDMNKGVRTIFTPSEIEREGKFIYYELNTSVVEEVMLWLSDLKGGAADEKGE